MDACGSGGRGLPGFYSPVEVPLGKILNSNLFQMAVSMVYMWVCIVNALDSIISLLMTCERVCVTSVVLSGQ